MTTFDKMLGLGFGFTKEEVGWTEIDETVLISLIPDPVELIGKSETK